MPPTPSETNFPTLPFPTAQAFELFLEKEHQTLPGLYLKLAKKSSGISSISGAEAVEIALCFGWIDGRADAFDENYWTVRFTPRREKSIWSKKNVDTVGRLENEGKMREMGRKVVREAKQDGRWSRAYAGPASIVVPKDLEKMLDGEEEAKRFFERLGKGDRYAVLWRIETASIKGRAKKIEAMVEILRRGKVPGKTEKVVGRPAVKKRKVGGVKKAKAAKSTSKPTTASTSSKDKTNYVRDEPVRQSRRPGLRART